MQCILLTYFISKWRYSCVPIQTRFCSIKTKFYQLKIWKWKTTLAILVVQTFRYYENAINQYEYLGLFVQLLHIPSHCQILVQWYVYLGGEKYDIYKSQIHQSLVQGQVDGYIMLSKLRRKCLTWRRENMTCNKSKIYYSLVQRCSSEEKKLPKIFSTLL